MIPEGRVGLNRRFIRVFQLLVERGDIVMNDRGGRGIGDFAQDILGKPYSHIIRAFLNEEDKRCIDYHHVDRLCALYGASRRYLLEGKGSPFGEESSYGGENRETLSYSETGQNLGNICYTHLEAFAGNALDWDSFRQEDRDFFRIPGLEGPELYAFPVKGNSMTPVIDEGDIVVCRPLRNWGDFRENKIYAINESGSIWVKYVQREKPTPSGGTRLKLISANHLEHDPFQMDLSEHTRLFQVIRRISALD